MRRTERITIGALACMAAGMVAASGARALDYAILVHETAAGRAAPSDPAQASVPTPAMR